MVSHHYRFPIRLYSFFLRYYTIVEICQSVIPNFVALINPIAYVDYNVLQRGREKKIPDSVISLLLL